MYVLLFSFQLQMSIVLLTFISHISSYYSIFFINFHFKNCNKIIFDVILNILNNRYIKN
jgi:hypothetical protein